MKLSSSEYKLAPVTTGPADRKARKKQLLLRAKHALHRAARQMGTAQNDHAGENGSDEDPNGLGREEDQGTRYRSDSEESDIDFKDLVRLYGTAPKFQARGLSWRTKISSCPSLICAHTCSALIIARAPCDAPQAHCLRLIDDGKHKLEMLT